jgi:hypothetical protein
MPTKHTRSQQRLNWLRGEGPNVEEPFSSSRTEFSESCHVFGQAILLYYAILHNIVERHEATMRQRWLWILDEDKEQIVLSARSDIPRATLPHKTLEASPPPHFKDLPRSRWYCLECMVPYLNLEDLLAGNRFLVFINSSGRYAPNRFAYTELRYCPLAEYTNECSRL